MLDKYSWSAAAYYSAKRIISRKYRAKAFLAEELLRDVVKDIGETYDYRCFGSVIRSLRGDGLIYNYDIAPAKSSNGSLKNLWRKTNSWSKK